MPAYLTCPICGFSGAHGFEGTPHGIRYYHDRRPSCQYIVTAWETFKLPGQYEAYVRSVAKHDPWFSDPIWIAGMLASFNTRKWVSAIQRELGCSARDARRLRDSWKERKQR